MRLHLRSTSAPARKRPEPLPGAARACTSLPSRAHQEPFLTKMKLTTRACTCDLRAAPRGRPAPLPGAARAPVRGDQAVVVLRAEAQFRHHLVDLLVQQRHVQVRAARVHLLHRAQRQKSDSAPARSRRRTAQGFHCSVGSYTPATPIAIRARQRISRRRTRGQRRRRSGAVRSNAGRARLQLVQQRGHALHVLAAGLQLDLDGLLARGHRNLLAVRRQELLLRARAGGLRGRPRAQGPAAALGDDPRPPPTARRASAAAPLCARSGAPRRGAGAGPRGRSGAVPVFGKLFTHSAAAMPAPRD